MTHSKVTHTGRDCEGNLYAYIMMQFFYFISKIKVQGHQQDFKLMSYLIAGINEMSPSHEIPGGNKIIYLWVQGVSRIFKYFF